jgi:hypothetical protein
MCRRVAGRPDEGLTRLLARYVDRLGSFAALFQPAPGQLPQLLPVLVGIAEAAAAAAQQPGANTGTDINSPGSALKACAALLRQCPWNATGGTLGDDDVTERVAPALVALATLAGRAAACGGQDADGAAELALLPLQVC